MGGYKTVKNTDKMIGVSFEFKGSNTSKCLRLKPIKNHTQASHCYSEHKGMAMKWVCNRPIYIKKYKTCGQGRAKDRRHEAVSHILIIN